MNRLSEQRLTGISGCFVALLIGVVVVALVRIGLWLQTGVAPDLQERWAAWLLWALVAATPFGYLALKGVGARVAWMAAALLTGAYWSVFIAIPLARPQDGNDLGATLLLLLYPVLATPGALAADRAARRYR